MLICSDAEVQCREIISRLRVVPMTNPVLLAISEAIKRETGWLVGPWQQWRHGLGMVVHQPQTGEAFDVRIMLYSEAEMDALHLDHINQE